MTCAAQCHRPGPSDCPMTRVQDHLDGPYRRGRASPPRAAIQAHLPDEDRTVSITVCLCAPRTLDYSVGGGHLWTYLNWALSLQAVGGEVIWLDGVVAAASPQQARSKIAALK